jgi:hypothetical protein
MHNNQGGWRDNERRLLDALRYLGVPVHDFGNGPCLAHEVRDGDENGEYAVVSVTALARTLEFI